MATLSYPSTAELLQIEQDKLPVLTQDDPIFEMFPIVDVDANILLWEQRDNYVGLQQARGLNGQPGKVKKAGGKRYKMEPGVYGDHQIIDEEELTIRRQWGTFDKPVSIDDLVMQAQDHLLNRRIDRIRLNLWSLLAAGTFSVYGQNGTLIHTDSFPLQTASAAVAWATLATAAPLADLRAIKLKARGHSVTFGRKAVAYANTKTVNNALNNTNSADVGGKRRNAGASVNSLQDLNQIFLDNDLPTLTEYDRGYLDDTGTFQPFIPDNVCVVVGARVNDQKLGEYRLTFNAVTGAPGPYTRVLDHYDDMVPPTVEVHDGHNGGPVIFFPSGVVILSC